MGVIKNEILRQVSILFLFGLLWNLSVFFSFCFKNTSCSGYSRGMRNLIPLVLGKLYLPSRLKNIQLAKFLPMEVRRIGKQGSSFPRNLILASCLAHLIEKILPSHKSHNTPLLPPNFCIGIVFVFSWNIFMQQDEILGRLKKTERPLPEKLRAYL